MTSNSSALLEQARRGQVTAITNLLNQSLGRQNLQATVERSGLTLTIVVTGDELPAPAITRRIEQGLRQIRPALTKEVVVHGQRSGNLAPQWSETIDLRPTPSPQAPATSPPDTPPPAAIPTNSTTATAPASTSAPIQGHAPEPKVKTRLPLLLGLIILVWVGIPFLAAMFGFGLPNSSRPITGWAVSPSALSVVTEVARKAGGLLLPIVISLFGLAPMSIQEGALLFLPEFRFRISYWSAFFLNLLTMIVMFIVWLVGGLIISFLGFDIALAYLLMLLAQASIYGSTIGPNYRTLGFVRACGLALFVDVVILGFPLFIGYSILASLI